MAFQGRFRVPGAFQRHFRGIPGTFLGITGTFQGCSRGAPGAFQGVVGAFQGHSRGIPGGIIKVFQRHSIAIL